MKSNNYNSPKENLLRKKAEEQLKKLQDKPGKPLSEADSLKLLHELQVHQIELEMMNEELRLARDKAETNEEKYAELYDFAPFGYLTLMPDATISELNLSAARLLGTERSVLINRNFNYFLYSDSKPVFDDFLRKVFENNEKASCELMLRTEDHTMMYVYLEGKNIENSESCLLTMIEITERRKAEKALTYTSEALKRSNAELEQFAYAVSHDLQEPLRMISGYIKFLEDNLRGTLDYKTSKYMDYIVDGSKRMFTLIKDLLAYSRVASQKEETVPADLNNVIEEVLKDLKLSIDDTKAEIKADKLPVVRANPALMRQLFQNLIANAIKFRGKENPVIYITFERKAGNLVFCVRDNGIGINPEFSERIFMIFQRLHEREKYPGTGIGLALCKKIVENHGGKIWIESEEGKGAAFYFTLPEE
ncbi:MAG: ATP-binding protein [Bacteroidota bacterium]|nr:ATP-binding protein [Bacteroidota bacterium]MDP4193166.1 ATP-binding protein [Bacteroidota bacterium]MDP4195581.1 ATP-binding protein [Bacteroidota bacterium]